MLVAILARAFNRVRFCFFVLFCFEVLIPQLGREGDKYCHKLVVRL